MCKKKINFQENITFNDTFTWAGWRFVLNLLCTREGCSLWPVSLTARAETFSFAGCVSSLDLSKILTNLADFCFSLAKWQTFGQSVFFKSTNTLESFGSSSEFKFFLNFFPKAWTFFSASVVEERFRDLQVEWDLVETIHHFQSIEMYFLSDFILLFVLASFIVANLNKVSVYSKMEMKYFVLKISKATRNSVIVALRAYKLCDNNNRDPRS